MALPLRLPTTTSKRRPRGLLLCRPLLSLEHPVPVAAGSVAPGARVPTSGAACLAVSSGVARGCEALGDALKWERSRNGIDFPHLYRPLDPAEALWSVPLPLDDRGVHVFPEDLS